MRKVRHWTPRYVYNRTRLMASEHARPEDPWLTPESVRLLSSMLRSADRGAEFGSGRSTIWFAERVGHLTSVEHNKQWYSTVSATLEARRLGNVEYFLSPRDQPKELGDKSAYARKALAFADSSVNFVLIDGLYREYATRFMIPKIKPSGLIIIDNVNWYLPSRTHSPYSRTPALGPNGSVWSTRPRNWSAGVRYGQVPGSPTRRSSSSREPGRLIGTFCLTGRTSDFS